MEVVWNEGRKNILSLRDRILGWLGNRLKARGDEEEGRPGGPPHWVHFGRKATEKFVVAAGALGLFAVRHRPPMVWTASTPILGLLAGGLTATFRC